MSDNLDLSASITTEEPEVAATLSDLRYLVFQGKKGDPGEDGVSFVSAYLNEGVVRYANAYGEHDADDIYTASAMAQDIDNGILPLLRYSPEDDVFDYFELDRYDIGGATWVVYFRSKDYLLSVDSTGAYTLTDRPQGGSGADEIAVIDIADDFSMSIGGDAVTAAEIVSLAQSGKTVIGRYDVDGDGGIIVTMHAATDEDDGGGNTGVTFTGVLFWRSAWHVCVADAGNNQSTLNAEYHQLLPAASQSDSGKVPTVNSTGGYSLQTPSGSSDAVLYTPQSLTDAQKAQARTNVGAGTYSKPTGGIPASDLAAGVIPTVPQMATQTDLSDWTSGKTVDAAAAKTLFEDAATAINGKVDTSELETAISNALSTGAAFIVFERQGVLRLVDLNDSEAATYSDVTDAIVKNNNVLFFGDASLGKLLRLSGLSEDENTGECTIVLEHTTATEVKVWTFTAPDRTTALTGTVTATSIETELPTVTASDNGKFLRVVSGAWAAATVQTWQGGSY